MTSPSAELPANLEPPNRTSKVEGIANGAALEIDHVLDELSQLAQLELSERDYYAVLLDRVIRLLTAEGAAAWRVSANGSTDLIVQVRFPRPLVDLADPVRGVTGIGRAHEPLVLPPFARASSRNPFDHPHPWPLVVCSVPVDAQSHVVMEIALDRDAGPEVQAGAARLMQVMADISGDFQRRREVTELRSRDAQLTSFKEMVARLHGGLDPSATAYTIANDGRIWIGCDRVCVLQLKRGKARTLAVSAVEHIDRRSGQVASLERLAAVVAACGESLRWSEGSTDELPPQILGALHDYLDIGHARQLVVIPLRQTAADTSAKFQPLQAMLIAESFHAEGSVEAIVSRAEELARISGSALGNALTHHALPLLPLQTRLATAASILSRRPLAALLGVAAVALAITLLAVVPAEFKVQAEGELQPQVRRRLFAPSDGVVEEVKVQHGDRVVQGDVLLRLRNSALDLDRSRLNGELQTAQARLSAVRSARSRPKESKTAADDDQLASEGEQLQQQIQGIESQLLVLEQLQSELTVASPLSGIVLTWSPHELLDDRPIKQGQVLLTVADASQPWELELHVPDRDTGQLLAGQRDGVAALSVEFLLTSDPAITHRGHLVRLAQTTDTSRESNGAEAIVAIDGPLPATARAGSHATARIHCGRRSIGYVWLHDVIDFARTAFWF